MIASSVTADALATLRLYGCSSEHRIVKTVNTVMETITLNVGGSNLAEIPCTAKRKGTTTS